MSMEFFRKTLDMLTQVNEDSSSASESEQLNESGYTGKGNHKPGWMRRADPALDKKLRDREKANRPPLPVPSEKKLDELSPATLGSYVKKASHEVGYHGGEEGRAAERRDRSTERQHSFKREKRQRGIGQAVGKMVGGPVDEGYLAEGTWSLPETPEAQKKLAALLSRPLTASVATKVLYNLIGDDTLFDRLGDAREWMDKEGIPAERQTVNDVVIDWMKKNSEMPGISETLAMLKGVSEAPQIGMLEKNAMKESITIGSVVKIETAPGTLARARVMAINEGQYTVATGSGTEYTVDYDDLWVKTRKLTESVDLDAWSQEYDENEEYNHHTENVLLVAELVGSPEDVAAVKKILQLRDRQGYLTSEQATAGYEIQSRLWPKVKKLFAQSHQGQTMHESSDEEDDDVRRADDEMNKRKISLPKTRDTAEKDMERIRREKGDEELDEADLVGLGEKSRAAKMPRGPVVEAETCCTVKYKMRKSDPEISVAEYDSREAAERFLASVKAKGGNGIISSKVNENDDEITDQDVQAAYAALHAAEVAGDPKRYALADRARALALSYEMQQSLKHHGRGFDPISGRLVSDDLDEMSVGTLRRYQDRAERDYRSTGDTRRERGLGMAARAIHSKTGNLEERQLDELSPETLKSYGSRALDNLGQHNIASARRGAVGDVAGAKSHAEKAARRERGLERAIDRLNELDRSGSGDDEFAALRQAYSRINTIDPDSPTYKQLLAKLDSTDDDTLERLAAAGIKFVSGLARNRVNRRKLRRGEQLDELSKETLKSYAKKAARDLKIGSQELGRAEMTPGGDKMDPDITRGKHYQNVRSQGLNRAIDRLGEEQLDELSKDTMTSYIKKASRGATDFEQVPAHRKAGVTTALKKKHDMGARVPATESLELSEKAVSKQQQKFFGMVHAAQKGEKPASKAVADVAKSMSKSDVKDFAKTKHKGLPKKADECTTAGGVATVMQTEFKNGAKMEPVKDSMFEARNKKFERLVAEAMNISVNLSTGADGQPSKSITISAQDDDAEELSRLLNLAGIDGMTQGEPEIAVAVPAEADCGCDEMIEENEPDWPTNPETLADTPTMSTYSGGLNKPKVTGQTTVPVTPVAQMNDRGGSMFEDAELERTLFKLYNRYSGE